MPGHLGWGGGSARARGVGRAQEQKRERALLLLGKACVACAQGGGKGVQTRALKSKQMERSGKIKHQL